MNIHQLKSFHENSLDQWNSIAIVLKEAFNTAPQDQRAQQFLQAVMALLDIAGTNQTRRDNIVKGANVVLQGLVHETERIPARPEEKTTSASPSFGKRLTTLFQRIGVILLILVGIAGAFLVGRLSMHPKIISLIPTVSPAPPSELSPDKLVQQYFTTNQSNDMSQVLALFSADTVKTRGEYLVRRATFLAQTFSSIQEIKILKLETEETAQVMVSVMNKQGSSQVGEFRLQKDQGEWRLVDVGL